MKKQKGIVLSEWEQREFLNSDKGKATYIQKGRARLRAIEERFYQTSLELHWKLGAVSKRHNDCYIRPGQTYRTARNWNACYRILEIKDRMNIRVRSLSNYGPEDKNDPGRFVTLYELYLGAMKGKDGMDEHWRIIPLTNYKQPR